MRRYKGEWILTDNEIEQNEEQNKQLIIAIKRLLKWKSIALTGMTGRIMNGVGRDYKYAERILKKVEKG